MDNQLSVLKDNFICVYGCGECGIQTYLLLREAGIRIDSFGDRDSSKAGYVIDGLFCIPYDEILCMGKQNIVLIVAIAGGEKIVDEFQKLGFAHVYYHENIKRELRAELRDKHMCGQGLDLDALRELKQDMERIVLNRELSIDKKRDGMLRLIGGKYNEGNDEAVTG